jgi:uncharacterized membrane protein YfcA
MGHLLLLALVGFVAGAMNALAGGGSFVTFPALVAVGLPSVVANASSTVALFPGSVASAWAYRRELRGIGGLSLPVLSAVSLAGGLTGAVLLLVTPVHTFDVVVPWLLLLATLIQFVLMVYGGYFGGAVGLMCLAAWSLVTATPDIKAMNPAKVLLVGAANSIAVVCFVMAGAVRWPETLAMLVTGIAGGYGGARIGRVLPARVLRGFVLALTASITAVFFWRLF